MSSQIPALVFLLQYDAFVLLCFLLLECSLTFLPHFLLFVSLVPQERADKLAADLEELRRTVNRRAKQLGLVARPLLGSETPFGALCTEAKAPWPCAARPIVCFLPVC